jgi:16S rRNA (cytosine1402-N4)-methyltransferase
MAEKHISVFSKEIIESLSIKPNGTYVDLTLGGGGHSNKILEKLDNGTLIVFDVDKTAITNFISELDGFVGGGEMENNQVQNNESGEDNENKIINGRVKNNTVIAVNANFVRLRSTLRTVGIERVDGIIADLGWSTEQLERVPGLSFKDEQELDMRFEEGLQVKARDLLNALGKSELKNLFQNYADIRGKQLETLVNKIMDARRIRPITTTKELVDLVSGLEPFGRKELEELSTEIHQVSYEAQRLVARVFQALRIAVNLELSTLQNVLPQAWEALAENGRLLVITFHSGEENIVRSTFESMISDNKARSIFNDTLFQVPSVEELRQNLRARSARLFGVSKK